MTLAALWDIPEARWFATEELNTTVGLGDALRLALACAYDISSWVDGSFTTLAGHRTLSQEQLHQLGPFLASHILSCQKERMEARARLLSDTTTPNFRAQCEATETCDPHICRFRRAFALDLMLSEECMSGSRLLDLMDFVRGQLQSQDTSVVICDYCYQLIRQSLRDNGTVQQESQIISRALQNLRALYNFTDAFDEEEENDWVRISKSGHGIAI